MSLKSSLDAYDAEPSFRNHSDLVSEVRKFVANAQSGTFTVKVVVDVDGENSPVLEAGWLTES